MKDGIYKSSTELCILAIKNLQYAIFNHNEEVRKIGQIKGLKIEVCILIALAMHSEKWQDRNFGVKKKDSEGSLEEHTKLNLNLVSEKHPATSGHQNLCICLRTNTYFPKKYSKKTN